MGNWDVSKPDNDGERELLDRAVKALEAEFATKTCNKQIASKLEDAELARDSEETCNNKQVISKLVASDDCISIQVVIEWLKAKDIIKLSSQEETARKELKALPSVTPKQMTGHWIEYTRVLIPKPINKWEQAWYCSECGYGNQECKDGSAWLEWNYCPNCGCRMVEPQEREDKE